MGLRWNLICFLALSSVLCGCAARHDLLKLTSKIPVDVTADPRDPLHELRTFAVIPVADAAREAAQRSREQPQAGGEITDPLIEKLFLQGAAQHLIARGYQQVEPNQSPDFVVFIQVSNTHQELYVPPSQITVPIYLPGTTTNVYSSVTAQGNWYGSGSVWSGSSYGGYSGSGYGTLSAQGRTSIRSSGRWTTGTRTVGGYTVSYFYPSVLLQMSKVSYSYGDDGQVKLDPIWRGGSTSVESNSNIKLYGGFLLSMIVDAIPCQGSGDRMGRLGIWWDESYQGPGGRVHILVAGAAAHRMGLQAGDILTQINGQELETDEEAAEIMRGLPPGSAIEVTYERDRRIRRAKATLVDMPYIEWK